MNRSSSLTSQMAALEAIHKEENDESNSPQNTNKGKLDMKHEDESDSNHLDNSGSGGGKSVNNECMNIKTEIKTEPMDVDNMNNDNAINPDANIKEEVMSPSASDSKSDIKPVFPEPIQPNATDKKKMCCKYLQIYS